MFWRTDRGRSRTDATPPDQQSAHDRPGALVETEQRRADEQAGEQVAMAIADANAQAHRDAFPQRHQQQRASVGPVDVNGGESKAFTAATHRPVPMTAAAISSAWVGVRRGFPKNFMAMDPCRLR